MKKEPIKTLNPDNTELSVTDEVEIENPTIAVSGIVSVTNTSDGRIEVFGVGGDNAVWRNGQTTHTGASWTGWSSLGGSVTSKPAAYLNSDGQLEVFVRGSDNALWHNWQNDTHSGSWSNWASLGGGLSSGPDVVENANGYIEVFVRATDNALWNIKRTSPSSWSSWASLGGTLIDASAIK
ncbi:MULTISPECIES: PLL family lectin [Photorhabdus]|uniref:hypothetical protein n=1 Tax=Photorhabdus TaxID=29487 RepID=UPI001E2B61BD|nr:MULTISPECIES: hypothetical protein [Photorhabdus]MCC8467145.1 hypothetical protein [Photorhabdus bodei]MCT8352973.1 hypothetical protein [Photorhabdus kayaii]MDB6368669.1 hypothetical protein [Photorhabdus bodei]